MRTLAFGLAVSWHVEGCNGAFGGTVAGGGHQGNLLGAAPCHPLDALGGASCAQDRPKMMCLPTQAPTNNGLLVAVRKARPPVQFAPGLKQPESLAEKRRILLPQVRLASAGFATVAATSRVSTSSQALVLVSMIAAAGDTQCACVVLDHQKPGPTFEGKE